MKQNFLFPNKFKKIGWFILIPSAIIGLVTLIYDYEPSFLHFNVPAIFVNEITLPSNERLFGMVNNNILNEILGVLIITSSLLVAFSVSHRPTPYRRIQKNCKAFLKVLPNFLQKEVKPLVY